MGRYNSNKLTTKYVQDYMKNRLWENDNSKYVPFINVRSRPTTGKTNRITGWKTGRVHHFLSKLEYGAFFYFEFSDDVIDIKEQYPLLPIEVLQNIAIEAGIEYPNENGKPKIMTTDFLITIKRNSEIIHIARTIKPYKDLSNKRILEKFEIEKRFFNSKNIDWGIITEKELSDVFINNMKILHSNKLTKNQTLYEKQYIYAMYKKLINTIEMETCSNIPIAYILANLSNELNINFSDVNEIFLKAIIDKIIILDIATKPLNANNLTLIDIKVNSELLSSMADNQKGGYHEKNTTQFST